MAKREQGAGKGGEAAAGTPPPVAEGAEGADVTGATESQTADPQSPPPPPQREPDTTAKEAASEEGSKTEEADPQPSWAPKRPPALNVAFTNAAHDAARRGDHHAHAQLSGIALAVGALKHRLAPALGAYDGELGELIENVYDVL